MSILDLRESIIHGIVELIFGALGVDFWPLRVISGIRQFVDSRNLDLMLLTLTIRESNWELWKSSLGLKESILDLWALGVDFLLIKSILGLYCPILD